MGVDTLRVTVVYDNYSRDPRLETGWGFAALLEHRGHVVLFDTGADAPTMLTNLRVLAVDPASIDAVVLSHPHEDHTGGLEGLLQAGVRPTVHLLPSFPQRFRRRIASVTTVVESERSRAVFDGMTTTGGVPGPVAEQALIVETARGMVIITGCAHPGVPRMVERAKELCDRPVHLVLGGFHLRHDDREAIRGVIVGLRELGVERLAPCHCTGDAAIGMFAAEYGERFSPAGVGLVVDVAEPNIEREGP